MFSHKILALFVSLLSFIILSTLIPVSSFHEGGAWHITLQVTKGLFITLAWGSFYYLLKVSFFERYKHIYKKEVPRIVLAITRFLILLFTTLSIIVFVLNKSILSIMALGGLVSAGLTFALGELILDAFSGVVMETETPFDVNDWIKTLDGSQGKVIAINWRTIILETIEGYLITVPHRKMAQGFINYSKPYKNCWDVLEVPLDHPVPVERAQRVLQAGLMAVPDIHEKQCKVVATKIDEGGITYALRYMISDFAKRALVKHKVIEYIMRHLRDNNLKISESLGEYSISKGGLPLEVEPPLSVEYLIGKVELFKKLPKSTITELSQKATYHLFSEGDIIVREGDEGQSLFIVAEGLVEVSIAYKNNAGVKKEKPLFHLGFSKSFGEMALLLNDKRSATVTAVTSAVVYEISQDLLKRSLKNNSNAFEDLKKQAQARKEKNKLTKSELEKIKKKKDIHSKGLLTSIEKFFR